MKPTFTCSYCSRHFMVKWKWIRHQMTHTKPFKCKFCGKAFAESSKAGSHEQMCYFACLTMATGKTKDDKVKISAKHNCKTFTCNYCCRHFTVKRKWIRHQMTHTKPFKCKFCGKTFAESSKAGSHEQMCYFACLTMATGKTNDDKVKTSLKHHCTTCKKTFATADNLKTHMRITHRNAAWKPCKSKLMKHRSLCNAEIKKQRKETKCQKKATGSGKSKSKKDLAFNTLSDHQYAIEPDKEISLRKSTRQCPECGVVVQGCSFSYHKKLHALTNVNKKYLAGFNCSAGEVFLCRYNTCYLAFDSLTKLTDHETIHTGSKPYMCGACDHLYRTSIKLDAHVAECKLRHLLSFPCGYCGKFFGRTGILWRHYESHRPNKMESYTCGLCKLKFSTRLELNKHHSASHQSLQPKTKSFGLVFKCNFCSENFKMEQNLLDHVQHCHLSMIASTSKAEPDSQVNKKQVPQGKSKLYRCSYCGQGFSRASRMTRHERIHTNEKPYVCYSCGQAFTFKYVLKRHQQKECMAIGDNKDVPSQEITLEVCPKNDDEIISISSSPSSRTQSPPTIPNQELAPVAIVKCPSNSTYSQIISLGTATALNSGLFASISCLPGIANQLYVFKDQPLSEMVPSQEMTSGPSLQPPGQDTLTPMELPSQRLTTAERILTAGAVSDLDTAIPMKIQRLT